MTPERVQEVRNAAKVIAGEIEHLSPEERRKLLKTLGSSPAVPSNWSARTNAPYYKRKYALQLKNIIDDMFNEAITTDKDKCKDRLIESYKYRLSPRSLIMRFNQAFLYLQEELDTPDGKYRQLRSEIEICREDFNIRFRWKDKARQVIHAVPAEDTKISRWKDDFEDFMERATEGMCFVLKNKGLSKDELKYIGNSLVGVEGFHLLSLESNLVKVLRADIEDKEVPV